MSSPALSAMKAPCEEKARLLRVHSFAISDYNRAVMVLNERIGVLRRYEYDRLRAYAADTRLFSERAREALNLHAAEHGC